MIRVALTMALLSISCGDEPNAEAELLLEGCGDPPKPDDYPSLELWRDDALTWMACARFSCSQIIVIPPR